MPARKKRSRARARVAKPPSLFDKTQKVVRRIEQSLGEAFLTYWNSAGGSVCNNDVVGLHEVLQKLGRRDRVTLFVKSEGGNGQASLRIVHLLRQHAGHLTAAVPLECASAATMLVLGADEIHMGPLAYLSAVDTSLAHDLSPLDSDNNRVSVSQDELMRVLKLWRDAAPASADGSNPYLALYPHVHPLVIGAVDRSSSLSVRICTEILSYHMAERGNVDAIAEKLNSAYPSHSFPITLREAERLGLAVRPLDPGLNEQLLELAELYSEMGQRAVTDFDERNYHDNEILNILEARDIQLYYQIDKDWHYRAEERRWVSLNDQSSWRRIEKVGARTKTSVFHVR